MTLLDHSSSAVITAAEGQGDHPASAGKGIIFKSNVTCGDSSPTVENVSHCFCIKVRGTTSRWQISQHPEAESIGGAEEI